MDDTKITTEDLYGSTSAPPAPPAQAPIPVEETPEIPMDTAVGTPVPPPPMPKVSRISPIIAIIIFLILFGAGMLLSSYIRPFFTGVGNGLTQAPTPTPVSSTDVLSPTPVVPLADWKTSTIAGLSYTLPPGVSEPTCDGTSCVSQGTYLPGGTRLTVASKTVTQPLSSLRGAIVTDAAGTAFTSQDVTISGHAAIEFYGTFEGRTTGGYGFSQMHGFMIEVGPTMTLEVNHFTPAGVTADWARDDELFTQIISTFDFSSVPTPAPTAEN